MNKIKVANPVVELNRALISFGCKIGYGVVDTQTHCCLHL